MAQRSSKDASRSGAGTFWKRCLIHLSQLRNMSSHLTSRCRATSTRTSFSLRGRKKKKKKTNDLIPVLTKLITQVSDDHLISIRPNRSDTERPEQTTPPPTANQYRINYSTSCGAISLLEKEEDI